MEQLATSSNAAASPATPAGSKDVAGNAEHEIDTIGRDALRLWGAWDGLSPVGTQMMAQTPESRPVAVSAAQTQGIRGRVGERLAKFQRDGAVPRQSAPRELGAAGDGLMHGQSLSESLKHEEREEAPFPYVEAVLSLHGVSSCPCYLVSAALLPYGNAISY